jgi:hypothetical protein
MDRQLFFLARLFLSDFHAATSSRFILNSAVNPSFAWVTGNPHKT